MQRRVLQLKQTFDVGGSGAAHGCGGTVAGFNFQHNATPGGAVCA